jgi:biotin carboxyl carrier protein
VPTALRHTATVDGVNYLFEARGPTEQKSTKARKGTAVPHAGGTGAITAIMPGLVVKVLKKHGDQVEAGEVVLILEAVKMQNELRAHQAGVIKQIRARECESVGMSQVLAIIE